MAYLNLSILNDDHTIQNAVFTIGGQGAENLKTVLAKCGNLMPGEMLQNLASSIQHLGDVKYMSNDSMVKLMETLSPEEQEALDNQPDLPMGSGELPVDAPAVTEAPPATEPVEQSPQA